MAVRWGSNLSSTAPREAPLLNRRRRTPQSGRGRGRNPTPWQPAALPGRNGGWRGSNFSSTVPQSRDGASPKPAGGAPLQLLVAERVHCVTQSVTQTRRRRNRQAERVMTAIPPIRFVLDFGPTLRSQDLLTLIPRCGDRGHLTKHHGMSATVQDQVGAPALRCSRSTFEDIDHGWSPFFWWCTVERRCGFIVLRMNLGRAR